MDGQALSQTLYRSLYRIRRTEEEIARVYPSDKVKSPVHLSIGQEAVSVAVCEALRKDDSIFGTYRSHAMYLAKGGGLKPMIAELYGKATGCCKGKGGSMHLMDVAAHVMGSSAVVGTTIPHAVGFAYANKYKRNDSIVAVFLGDGATEEGVFAESINFAVLKKVPLLFVVENNGYAIHTHQSLRQGVSNICAISNAFGVPSERIDDNDILKIYSRTLELSAEIRDKKTGPRLIECMTYRWKEHVGPNEDYDLGYRSKDEARTWFEQDQVPRLAGLVDQNWRKSMELEVEAEIRDAFQFAESSPFPTEEELLTDVFHAA